MSVSINFRPNSTFMLDLYCLLKRDLHSRHANERLRRTEQKGHDYSICQIGKRILLCWESSLDLRKKERKRRKIKWNKLLIYLSIKEIRHLWGISLKDKISKKKILVSETPTKPLVLQEFSELLFFFFKALIKHKSRIKTFAPVLPSPNFPSILVSDLPI